MSLGASIPEPPPYPFNIFSSPQAPGSLIGFPKSPLPALVTESHTEVKKPTKREFNPRSVSRLKVFREWQRQTNENSQNSSAWFLKSRHKTTQKLPTFPHPLLLECGVAILQSIRAQGPPSPQISPCLISAGLRGRLGARGSDVCEENTKIPLLGGHSVYVCDGEGRAVRVLRRSTNKASQLTLYYLWQSVLWRRTKQERGPAEQRAGLMHFDRVRSGCHLSKDLKKKVKGEPGGSVRKRGQRVGEPPHLPALQHSLSFKTEPRKFWEDIMRCFASLVCIHCSLCLRSTACLFCLANSYLSFLTQIRCHPPPPP